MFTNSRLIVLGWLLIGLAPLMLVSASAYLEYVKIADPGIGYGLASMATWVITIPIAAVSFVTGLAILRRTNDNK